MAVVESKEWYLSAYVSDGLPTSDHLKLRSVNLSLAADSIPDQHVALEILWISVDPYLRSIMSGHDDGLCIPQFQLNQAITAFGIGRVVGTKDNNFAEGDVVVNPLSPIAEYCVASAAFLRKIDTSAGIPLPDYLNSLGLSGFTAWVGIEVLGNLKPGSNVFISAAAGGVGMVAGKLAKLKGCRVVGSTGSDEKVKLLKDEFGYDDAFNYHTETDFDAALSKRFPDGIDIYFENVGGKMLEAVLNNVNKGARIPLCGMISQYNQRWTEREGVRNLLNMVGKEVRMEGFMLGSYMNRFGDFMKEMEGYIKEGKIISKHRIYNGIESFLESFNSMFSSSNVGKVIIQVRP
ncbi:2-alkenal reductase (NADP(+)-dependent) [Camellia lanceoleosa]|uniref:2-alkenal reductase (NADP(+)-dependent) n=1 Tax=Camellia lanceoleosa TaxID=1840588 RepID=A0ACC0GYD8_9ERIC|nr:2-alkenal reductase (NADP(+)-dependent) [Camellia lanceoleosa]